MVLRVKVEGYGRLD